MGCDIHLYTEKKIEVYGEEYWWCCDYFTPNSSVLYKNENGEDFLEPEYEHISIYNGRDYELFGALAGVRDQFVNTIAPPRGLPKDVSPHVKQEADRWGTDGHSHSWYTADELFKYQKDHSGNSSLNYLVKKIKKKIKEEFDIYPFEDKATKKEKMKTYAKQFRIVFWFDN